MLDNDCSSYPPVTPCKRTRMDHLSAVLQGNLDNLVASQIRTDRRVLAALANDVRLIGLCTTMYISSWTNGKLEDKGWVGRTLPVHAQTVLITGRLARRKARSKEACSWHVRQLPEHRNGVERQFVSLSWVSKVVQ